jgi:uncharacterized membrane protein (DUF373 family)
VLPAIQDKLRINASQRLHQLETTLYVGVGLLLSVAAIAAVYGAGVILWRGIINNTLNYGLLVLDQLLLVLMLVEILHTVRISIRSEELITEPFLIVGLIASIRRVLVITMQAAKLTEEAHGTPETEVAFRNSMIELGLLGFLVAVLALSIYLLRRTPATRAELLKQ